MHYLFVHSDFISYNSHKEVQKFIMRWKQFYIKESFEHLILPKYCNLTLFLVKKILSMIRISLKCLNSTEIDISEPQHVTCKRRN